MSHTLGLPGEWEDQMCLTCFRHWPTTSGQMLAPHWAGEDVEGSPSELTSSQVPHSPPLLSQLHSPHLHHDPAVPMSLPTLLQMSKALTPSVAIASHCDNVNEVTSVYHMFHPSRAQERPQVTPVADDTAGEQFCHHKRIL